MKQILVFLLTIFAFNSFGQNSNTYQYKVDLTRVEEDKLTVTLLVPENVRQKNELVKFQIPKIIPGTYSIYDFGRYASDFKAYDSKGKEIASKKTDNNTWEITNSADLQQVIYRVEDTWDTKLVEPYTDDFVFEPAGTNFEEGANFVFNLNGLCGYFDGFQRMPFYLEFDRPQDFFGATALERTSGDKDTDVFFAPNYMDLVDGPIMFSKPDTAMIRVGNADVLIANYSPQGKVSAKFIAQEIEPILQAQKEYLGGTLPVTKYAFIIYLSENSNSGNFGALEHSYSSFYFLPESEPENITQIVRDVAAHEFFHIVTPLNIHSEEIHDFDYINPKMSKHLWMYEGVTEYSAGHVQVKHGLMSIEDYLEVLESKMRNADNYKDDLAFTTMSRLCLHEHKDQYGNVYEKGALIGMCVDIEIRKRSKGQKGIQELMRDLSKNYGKDQAFKDEELFDKIGRLTHKNVKKFLLKYVDGPTPLPLKAIFEQVGITYYAEKTVLQLSPMGGLGPKSIGFDGENFIITSLDGMDDFATKNLGFQRGDKLLKWNGVDLMTGNINQVIGTYMQSVQENDKLTITVGRGGKEVDLSSDVVKISKLTQHVLELNPKATASQIQLRKAWLGGYKMEADMK
jgi:predicted metalloprotease with PDZ domain